MSRTPTSLKNISSKERQVEIQFQEQKIAQRTAVDDEVKHPRHHLRLLRLCPGGWTPTVPKTSRAQLLQEEDLHPHSHLPVEAEQMSSPFLQPQRTGPSLHHLMGLQRAHPPRRAQDTTSTPRPRLLMPVNLLAQPLPPSCLVVLELRQTSPTRHHNLLRDRQRRQ